MSAYIDDLRTVNPGPQRGVRSEQPHHPVSEDRMCTPTRSRRDAVEHREVTTAPSNYSPATILRIAAMTRGLLAEVRAQHLDGPGVQRLRAIDAQALRELQSVLPVDLRHELVRLAVPLTLHGGRSVAELRLAHAQLVGWLEGLLATMQTETATSLGHGPSPNAALCAAPTHQCATTAARSPTSEDSVARAESSRAETHCAPTPLLADLAHSRNAAIAAARRTLMTAITGRLMQERLSPRRAAALLHLTEPRVSALMQADIDGFTLDELASLLPTLGLRLQVVSEADDSVQPLRAGEPPTA
jgi:predicted XRE-type DNA-binding protein